MTHPQTTVIHSANNDHIKELLHSDQYLFFEGSKLCLDILSNRNVIIDLLVILQEEYEKISFPSLENVREIWLVSDRIMAKLSEMKSIPSLLMATRFRPQKIDFKKCRALLALLDVQNPGNVGTLIRTACAFGFSGVALIGKSVKITNRKLIRSAQNALFQIPLHYYAAFADFAAKCRQHQLPLYITSSTPLRPSLGPDELNPPCTIVLGNEGSGFPQEIQSQFPSVRIPHLEKIESLNVAVSGSILMHEVRKKWGYE